MQLWVGLGSENLYWGGGRDDWSEFWRSFLYNVMCFYPPTFVLQMNPRLEWQSSTFHNPICLEVPPTMITQSYSYQGEKQMCSLIRLIMSIINFITILLYATNVGTKEQPPYLKNVLKALMMVDLLPSWCMKCLSRLSTQNASPSWYRSCRSTNLHCIWPSGLSGMLKKEAFVFLRYLDIKINMQLQASLWSNF